MEKKANETSTPAADNMAEGAAAENAGSCGKTASEACSGPNEIDKIMQLVEEKSRQLEEMSDRYKRLQADFDNFRRRTRQEKEELSTLVTESVMLQLLPVVDNFERAIGSADGQDAAAVRTGVEMIYRQMMQVFDKIGVAPIEAEGKQFDPQLHDAVLRVEGSDQPDNIVIEELQKGYTLRGKVIRPSMVKVSGS